ncbi:antitoxin [Streptomyces sp. NPDC090021]|uniref:antitoxin n=1 Tax=Streptomyces sp. NPDC090021 TaxID=3365919 RepID=UPI0038018548
MSAVDARQEQRGPTGLFTDNERELIMFDSLKGLVGKATELATEHSEVLAQGLEKAADVVDEKTDGKYSDHIDTGVDKAKGFLADLGEKSR